MNTLPKNASGVKGEGRITVCVHLHPDYEYANHRRGSARRIRPQALPFDLEALWQKIVDHAQRFGFAFGQTAYWAQVFGCSERHANRILRCMALKGRLLCERVAGSHDRHFYPVALPPVPAEKPVRIVSRKRREVGAISVSPYESLTTLCVEEATAEETAPEVVPAPEPVAPAVAAAAVDILTDLGMAEKDARDVLQRLKPSLADVKATVAHVRAYKRKIPSLGGFVRDCLKGRWWENQAGYRPSAPQKGTSGAKPAYSEYRGEDEDRKPAKKREKAFDVALRTLQQREREEGKPFTMRDLLTAMVSLLRSDPHRLEYHSPTSMEDTQRIGELALERLEKQGEAYLTPNELRQEMGRIYHQEQNFGGKEVAA